MNRVLPNIGPLEWVIILIVALVVFGPSKLPELGRSLGRGLREFRRASREMAEELEGVDRAEEKPAPTQADATPPPDKPKSPVEGEGR